MATFKQGYQRIYWNSQIVHVYGQKDGLDIGLLSTPNYKEVRTINNIDDNHVHWCKINCSYFINVTSSSEYGQVLGREQGFTEDNKPDQNEWLDVVVTNSNKIIAGQLNSWDYPKSQVKCGYSPAVILIYEGKDVTMISSAAGTAKYNNANTQTLHMQDASGRHFFAAVSGKLNGPQCRAMAKAYGMTFCSMLDSGGSTQMRADGKNIVYTGRKIPNVLTFYESNSAPVVKEKEEKTPIVVVPVLPETSNIDTRFVKCVKGTLQNGTKYPTRKTISSTYDPNNYLINVGDILQFDDVSPIAGRPDCYFQICGGSRADLLGRWFAYDKDYFD